jgi:hypothetical protein
MKFMERIGRWGFNRDRRHLPWVISMSALERQLRGWRLTTAEILYHMPDHPSVLQSFVWQQLDLAPNFRPCGTSWISGIVSWKAGCTR